MNWLSLLLIAALGVNPSAPVVTGVCSDDGLAGLPLHGWVGYTNTGEPIPGMRIQVISARNGDRIASTITDSKGQFSFPHLVAGKYRLLGTKRHYFTINETVETSKGSDAMICLVAETGAN